MVARRGLPPPLIPWVVGDVNLIDTLTGWVTCPSGDHERVTLARGAVVTCNWGWIVVGMVLITTTTRITREGGWC